MTTTDPRDPKAWQEAAAIAHKAAGGPVTKHADALPFLFDTAKGPALLVHQGKLVTDRGPVVAGAYLRDLGIIKGMGPQIDDVVYVLTALDALPTVDKLGKDAFIHTDNPRDAGLTARIESDGQTAQIVLHYRLEGPPVQQIDPDPSHKKVEGSKGGRLAPSVLPRGETSPGRPDDAAHPVEGRCLVATRDDQLGRTALTWLREVLEC